MIELNKIELNKVRLNHLCLNSIPSGYVKRTVGPKPSEDTYRLLGAILTEDGAPMLTEDGTPLQLETY